MKQKLTGYPSIDKPWLKYYAKDKRNFILPNLSVYDFMLQNNKDNLDATALDYFGKEYSYRELIDKIDCCADAFLALGIKQGDAVSFCNPTTPEIYYAFYALNKIGAVANMIDPRTNSLRIEEFILKTHSTVVFYIDIAYPKIKDILSHKEIKKAISISAADSLPLFLRMGYQVKNWIPTGKKAPSDEKYMSWKQFFTLGLANKETYMVESDHPLKLPAGIVYTSGTTGVPKGAVLSNKNLLAMVYQNLCAEMGWAKNDRFLGIMPPFIAYGLVCGFALPLCLGMRVTIIPKFEVEKFDTYILKYRPHHIMGVPSHIERLMFSDKLRKTDLSFLKTVIVGGDKMNPEDEVTVNDFLKAHNSNCRVIKGYGLTEMSSNAVFPRCNECNKIGSVGTPLVGNNIKVINLETGQELGYNEIGEICLTGPTLIDGYLNNEEESKKVFKMEEGVRWLHTGDTGYIDEDGVVFFCDRLKQMIVRYDGFKIYPAKIENVIRSIPDIKDCCVVGIQDREHPQGELPLAYIEVQNTSSIVPNDLRDVVMDACQRGLPEYSQPVDIRICCNFPITNVGKIDFRALQKMATEGNNNP